MGFWLALICIAGLLADVWFIRTEYAGNMAKATLLKGIASAFFVLLGLVCFLKVRTAAGQLIFIGLILGLFGDVFLNLRNQFEGAKSRAVFAVGILAFLSGHFLYIAALIRQSASILLLSAILTAVLSVVAIPAADETDHRRRARGSKSSVMCILSSLSPCFPAPLPCSSGSARM